MDARMKLWPRAKTASTVAPAPPDQDPTRVMVVTDAWEPQVNGVVRTLARTVQELRDMGVEVEVVSPADGYKTIPLITYEEIKLALWAKDDIEERFKAFAPDAVHIATEGPLGWAARAICLAHKFPFTSSYHTQYPEYVNARFPLVPVWAVYKVMRAFHDKSGRVMVATPTMLERLQARGFKNLALWSRGVDTELFHPAKRGIDGGVFKDLQKPVFLYVGRVAVEKNIDAFLETDLPGSKVVVGDGPSRQKLMERYPDVHFVGSKFGEELARHFADADVFVFPSLTDTFGLVIIEAMATGTPVAAYVAPGPKDIIPGSNAGVIGDDLRAAAIACLSLDRTVVRQFAEQFSWTACTRDFLHLLQPLPRPEKKRFWKRLRALRRGKNRPPHDGAAGIKMH